MKKKEELNAKPVELKEEETAQVFGGCGPVPETSEAHTIDLLFKGETFLTEEPELPATQLPSNATGLFADPVATINIKEKAN